MLLNMWFSEKYLSTLTPDSKSSEVNEPPNKTIDLKQRPAWIGQLKGMFSNKYKILDGANMLHGRFFPSDTEEGVIVIKPNTLEYCKRRPKECAQESIELIDSVKYATLIPVFKYARNDKNGNKKYYTYDIEHTGTEFKITEELLKDRPGLYIDVHEKSIYQEKEKVYRKLVIPYHVAKSYDDYITFKLGKHFNLNVESHDKFSEWEQNNETLNSLLLSMKTFVFMRTDKGIEKYTHIPFIPRNLHFKNEK